MVRFGFESRQPTKPHRRGKKQSTERHQIFHNGKMLFIEIERYATFAKAYIIDNSKYFCVVDWLRFSKGADAKKIVLEVRDYCIINKIF